MVAYQPFSDLQSSLVVKICRVHSALQLPYSCSTSCNRRSFPRGLDLLVPEGAHDDGVPVAVARLHVAPGLVEEEAGGREGDLFSNRTLQCKGACNKEEYEASYTNVVLSLCSED